MPNTRKILIVDDDTELREGLTEQLSLHEEFEAVGAAQPVAWFIGRPPEGVVVAPVMRVLAPGIVRADAAHRQQCPRPRQAIGAPP